jgi:hypothetical protein
LANVGVAISQDIAPTGLENYNPNAAPGTPGSIPANYVPPAANFGGFLKSIWSNL